MSERDDELIFLRADRDRLSLESLAKEMRLAEVTTKLAAVEAERDKFADDFGELGSRLMHERDDALGQLTATEKQLSSALAEVEALRERVHNERLATVAYLLDRAEQYSNSSGYRALFDELVGDIAEGEHAVSLREGEYDDMRKRLDRIFATHTPKDALSPATPRGKGGADE
jgi:chromosome segregation ATPase